MAVDGGAGEDNLYEWVDGSLRLVNVLPGNTETHPGAVFGSGKEMATSAGDPDYSHAISSDGSRVYWTDEASGHVYLREITGMTERTILVPDSEGGRFLTASADGSRVLLSDGHVYALEGEAFVLEADLTEGQHAFGGLLGSSEDLSSVYFIDSAALNSEENSEHEKAHAGESNLYLRRGATTVFIATLAATDALTEANADGIEGNTGDWVASPADRTAQVTPDGEYLAFMSHATLTPAGHDNQPAEPQDCVTGLCFEVYEYDVATNRVVCASCNPTGERPVGFSALSLIKPGSGAQEQPHNLSTNGRLFFDSLDTLSPHDTNGNAEDVYEYEPQNVGTCSQPNGCVSLLSGGTENTNSSFLNANPSGSNAFITTRTQLTPQDQDDLLDLYDVRENGGITLPPEPEPCTNNETCKPQPPPQPLFQTLPSNTLTTNGNLTPPPVSSKPSTPPKPVIKKCPKGKHLFHKKCVKEKIKKHPKRAEAGRRSRTSPKNKRSK